MWAYILNASALQHPARMSMSLSRILTLLMLRSMKVIIQGHNRFLANIVLPKQALHGAHGKETMLLQSSAGSLDLLYARAESTKYSVRLEALRC